MTRGPHPIIAELRARRQAARLSQVVVAERIRYSTNTVGRGEVGARGMAVAAVEAYAGVLGLRLVLGDGGWPFVPQLAALRVAAGLSQTGMGERLGCGLGAVWRLEAGLTTLTLNRLSAYANLFGLELELREVPRADQT